AEPVALTQTQFEYRVLPDARRPLAHEVYSIDRVTATAPDGRRQEFRPLFAVRHGDGDRSGAAYWHATRRPAERAADRSRAPPAAGPPPAPPPCPCLSRIWRSRPRRRPPGPPPPRPPASAATCRAGCRSAATSRGCN